MEETYTSKLKKHTEKSMFYPKDSGCENHEVVFERKILLLLDRQLISPRKQIIDRVLDYSKSTL